MMKNKKLSLRLLGLAILILAAAFLLASRNSGAPTHKQPPVNAPSYPINKAASLWVVVNKGRALPASYTPSDLVNPAIPLQYAKNSPTMFLRSQAATALQTMAAA